MADPSIIPQVIEYLNKKGYTRTEAMLRTESAHQDNEVRPIQGRAEDGGGAKYGKALCECKVVWVWCEHADSNSFAEGLGRWRA
jgi:hypothetical protein